MTSRRVLLIAVACTLAGAHAAWTADVSRAVAEARTQAIEPRATPPAWMEWDRVSRGFAFFQKHQSRINQVLGTTSLVSTYAAVDIAPVLIRTGRLSVDYNKRIMETAVCINQMLTPVASKDDFVVQNYRRAYQLGKLHASIASSMTPDQLGFRASERVPINRQAFALVLYSFAWQPLESLAAAHQLDLAAEADGVDGWCHLWSVLGYAMGESEDLLPKIYARAAELVPQVRAQQYAAKPADVPSGVPVLLRGELGFMMTGFGPNSAAASPESQRRAAKSLADAIALSPGLGRALGLGDQPADDLLKILQADQ